MTAIPEELRTNWEVIAQKIQSARITTVYIPDTNILLGNGYAPFFFTGNEIPDEPDRDLAERVRALHINYGRDPNAIVMLTPVLTELDRLKDNDELDPFRRRNLYCAIRSLEDLILCNEKGPRSGVLEFETLRHGIPIGENGALSIQVHYHRSMLPPSVEPTPDNEIAWAAKYVQDNLRKYLPHVKVVFISNDNNARLTALNLGVIAEESRYDAYEKPDYPGYLELTDVPPESTKILRAGSTVSCSNIRALNNLLPMVKPNTVIYFHEKGGSCTVGFVDDSATVVQGFQHFHPGLFRDRVTQSDEIPGGLSRVERKRWKRERRREESSSLPAEKFPFGGHLRLTYEQMAALELCLNPQVTSVSITGQTGSGKTLIAILAGLAQLEGHGSNRFRHITYVRPAVPIGRPIGDLPGGMQQKMTLWTKAVEANLREIYNYWGAEPDERDRITAYIQDLLRTRNIAIEHPGYVQGDTWSHTYVIIDEAQQFSATELRMIVTRAGEKSKLIVVGDPRQVIANRFSPVTQRANGLLAIVTRLAGDPTHGHISLRRVMRSQLAEKAEKI